MEASLHKATQDPHATLIEEIEDAWRRTDAIFSIVPEDALGERPIALRHPFVFYVGHLPAFTWNLLGRGVLGRTSSRPEFDRLFDFGIDPDEDEAVPDRTDWPPLAEILRYRDRVRDEVRACGGELLQRAEDDAMADGGRILHVVLEHELMHHETLCYMLQELDPRRKVRSAAWPDPETGDAAETSRSVPVPVGDTRLGADFDQIEFGWDNEFPARLESLPHFELDSLPVTVGEYLEFVEAGGYGERSLWRPEGWVWIQRHGATHPRSWIRDGERWLVRSVIEPVPLDEVRGWPAQVTWVEANAYARWRDARLPAEAELSRAAYGTPGGDDDDERPYPWGFEAPRAEHGNFDFRRSSPEPVGRSPAGASAFGVQELVGNGWEWTATAFARHAGFENYMSGYPGYSQDFFDGHHYVIFGASWATEEKLLRRTFRNWFRYNYPYAFTKFRLAR